MDHETAIWILRIGIIVISAVISFRYKRQLAKMASDIMVGGDTREYVGKDVAEVRNRVKERMDEVLK